MNGYIGRGPETGRAAQFIFAASNGQSAFSGLDGSGLTLTYTPGFILVFVNGRKVSPSNYTATDKSTITFTFGLQAGDIVEVWAFSVFSAADGLAKTQNLADVPDKIAARSILPNPGALFGCTMSTAGSSATLTVAAGYAADSTNVKLMRLASPLAKTTSSWVAGNGGGLDTGTAVNGNWYHWFVIYNPTTDTTDVLFSLSPTAPTLPSGYTLFRRIGSWPLDPSTLWYLAIQDGDRFMWGAPFQNPDFTVSSTSATLITVVGVPPGIATTAHMSIMGFGAALAPGCFYASDPALSDVAALSTGGAFTGMMYFNDVSYGSGMPYECRTNTSRQIRMRFQIAAGTVRQVTRGWTDTRGRNG